MSCMTRAETYRESRRVRRGPQQESGVIGRDFICKLYLCPVCQKVCSLG